MLNRTEPLKSPPRLEIKVNIHVFFIQEKFLLENEPQKPKNLKKMLRKSPVSDT